MNRKNFSNKLSINYKFDFHLLEKLFIKYYFKEVIYKYFLDLQENNRKGSCAISQFRFI